MNNCNENWHIFDGGLPKPSQVCKCGKKVATDKIGVFVDNKEGDQS
jgi:hypothetical protein